jgi:hypothetical protein
MILRALVSLFLIAAATGGEVPEFYRTVERMVFVVPDAAKAAAVWKPTRAPVTPVRSVDLLQSGGEKLRVKLATVQFKNVAAEFIEPVTPRGVFSSYLRGTGGGVFALVHRVASAAALDAELDRLHRAGVETAADITSREGKFTTRCVYLDTTRRGKYSLALAVMPDPNPLESPLQVTQYAFVAKDLEAVSAYWAKLGFPEMTYSRPDSSELVYRGQPGKFTMKQGWHRYGKVTYEWLQPLGGPSTYEDHLARHGEGFHHMAFNVDDMDEGNRLWDAYGFPNVMSGAWGKKGQPGSGRFAYHDLEACCGSEIELLWSYKAK